MEGIYHGDCRELMKEMENNSVDAVVTDPPYELGFMGKNWDRTGIAYRVEVWQAVIRVLKPGGHLLAAGGSRTHHRLACAIEDAGFELRDTICHVFGTGFPKSLDVSKAIDAEAGVKREVVGRKIDISTGRPMSEKQAAQGRTGESSEGWDRPWRSDEESLAANCNITAPVTGAAKRWQGWGTALKPAAEYWTVARKPLQGTVAQNVQEHGTGGLNVDACRVGEGKRPFREGNDQPGKYEGWGGLGGGRSVGETDQGRWPPNLVLTHSASCGDECAPDCPVAEMDRQSGCLQSGDWPNNRNTDKFRNVFSEFKGEETGGREANSGGASRFFPCFRYEAKPSRAERDEGLGDLPLRSGGELTGREDGAPGTQSPSAGAGRNSGGRNIHPTVKPIALMRWLVRLVTPPGGLVLDPFAGSGSTGCATVAEGFRFVGMEKERESADIARRRIEYWEKIGHQVELF